MGYEAATQEWILLVHQLPAKPTSLRVRVWRQLQKLGAVLVKNSVYVLPFNDKTHEDFQWLKQEIESAGGEAAIFRADAVEGATREEIVAVFVKAREDEYANIRVEVEGLTGAIREQKRRGHLSEARIGAYESELDRFSRELERVAATDFFQAPGRAATMSVYERCRELLRLTRGKREQGSKSGSVEKDRQDFAQYQGRRWATRPSLFVDRLASIWLIKRFIDKRARFYFVPDTSAAGDRISFDMYGADFSHQGEDCTFETMIKRFGLTADPGLQAIAEIVHDIDLKDNKFGRSEAAGLGATIRGLADLLKNDRKLVSQCSPLFDGLYHLFSGEVNQLQRKAGRDSHRSRSRRSR
ncbi:MAG TPA: chromate resistance protein ChrB domain-containing protein [Blastocatellia bacterium]|nr:chromate resistance protein ChrB domain-containing protein [Blastocatellia bacterium]